VAALDARLAELRAWQIDRDRSSGVAHARLQRGLRALGATSLALGLALAWVAARLLHAA
jgi:hypothetical protein